MAFNVQTISMDAVPGRKPSKYQSVIDALNAASYDQAEAIRVPSGMEGEKFYNLLNNALSGHIQGKIGRRVTKDTVFLWRKRSEATLSAQSGVCAMA